MLTRRLALFNIAVKAARNMSIGQVCDICRKIVNQYYICRCVSVGNPIRHMGSFSLYSNMVTLDTLGTCLLTTQHISIPKLPTLPKIPVPLSMKIPVTGTVVEMDGDEMARYVCGRDLLVNVGVTGCWY